MGYEYRFDIKQNVRITPPINYSELKLLEDAGYANYRSRDAYVCIETTETIENGAKVSRISDAFIAANHTGRDPSSDLREIYELLKKAHTFQGHLRATGELGDHMRWYITDNGMVAQEEAKLIWPDGTTEKIQV